MTKLQSAEFSARIIAWLGAWLLETVTVYERISNSSFPLYTIIILWIIVAATYITGFLDMRRFTRRNETS